MPKQLTPQSYAKLLTSLRSHITTGIQQVEFHKVNTYWNIGRSINLYLSSSITERGQITAFYNRLSADLDISGRTLQHCEQFFRYFPVIDPKSNLSWSHYRNLLVVDSPQVRKKWLNIIRKENLTSRELKVRLIPGKSTASRTQLKVVRGRLYTYRIIKNRDQWMVDCGFANRVEAPPSKVVLNNKYLYTSVKTSDGYGLKAAKAAVDELYMFKAQVKRVVDGDTLIVFIDQGFGVWSQQRLRLRGINCPELDTQAGEKAKKFVQETLKKVKDIVIKTYKSDKYGRYLADIFYLPKEPDCQTIAQQDTFLNQELLDKGLAEAF